MPDLATPVVRTRRDDIDLLKETGDLLRFRCLQDSWSAPANDLELARHPFRQSLHS
jgi:hypothetical protein